MFLRKSLAGINQGRSSFSSKRAHLLHPRSRGHRSWLKEKEPWASRLTPTQSLLAITSPIAHLYVQLANVLAVKLGNHNLAVKLGVIHSAVELLIVDWRPDKAIARTKVRRPLVIDRKELASSQFEAFYRIDRATNYIPRLSAIAWVVAQLMAMKWLNLNVSRLAFQIDSPIKCRVTEIDNVRIDISG